MKFIWAVLLGLGLQGPSALAEINQFKDKILTVRTYVDAPSYEIDIQSKVNQSEVIWKPNLRTLVGVDISINDFIGIGGSWANNDAPGSAQAKGVTNFTDYRLGLTLTHIHLDANFEQFTGFYVDNTNQIAPSYTGSGISLQDSSMTGGNISVNGTYIFSPERFSFAAASGQNERQETSGGSFLLGLAASDTYFSSGNYLIPAQVRSNFGEDQNIKNALFYSLSAKFGYGYTFTWSRYWFTSLLFNLGFGAEYRSYGDGVTQFTSGGGTQKLDALISLGYNGDTFIFAVILTGDDTTYSTKSLNIPSILGDGKLVFGMHF